MIHQTVYLILQSYRYYRVNQRLICLCVDSSKVHTVQYVYCVYILLNSVLHVDLKSLAELWAEKFLIRNSDMRECFHSFSPRLSLETRSYDWSLNEFGSSLCVVVLLWVLYLIWNSFGCEINLSSLQRGSILYRYKQYVKELFSK